MNGGRRAVANCLSEQDPDENDCRIHEDDAYRRISHRPAGLYVSSFARQGGSRALGRGEADHGRVPASVEFREILAILAILALAAVCFIAGLIVRTGPGLRAKNAVEETLLEKLPGYTLLRGLAGRASPVRRTNQALRRRSPRSKRHWFRL
jgi:hypothetical protein